MGPHANDLDNALRFEDLIDESVLNVDAARIGPREISHQLFKARRTLKWILTKNVEQFLRVIAKTAAGDLVCVLLRLGSEDDSPVLGSLYQPGFSEVFASGVRRPLRIDSRMPGTERRYRVS